jgi:hypothetical protein
MSRWQQLDDGDRAGLVRAIVGARRATRARAAFSVWMWTLIPSVGLSGLVPEHRLWGALAGMALDTVACATYLVISRRREPRTVSALRGEGGVTTAIVGLSSFSNGTSTMFTRVRFAGGRTERLEDPGLAEQLSTVLELPVESGPRGSLW